MEILLLASIPIVLNELNEKGLIERGDKLLLTGFGGRNDLGNNAHFVVNGYQKILY